MYPEITDNEDICETPEFDSQDHALIHNVQIDDLVLEVYGYEEKFRWDLVDNYGRVHHSARGFQCDVRALQAGINFALRDKPESSPM